MQHEAKVRDIFFRNTGQIRGSLSELEPFLLLAEVGASHADLRGRISERRKGRFVIGQAAGEGTIPKLGLLLPVARCRNAAMRTALLDLKRYLVTEYQYHRAKLVRDQAQRALNKVFGDDFRIHPRASLDGFVEFERTKGLFRVLSEHFDYIEALRDDPRGTAVPLVCRPFSWPSYGQLMEWFHDGIDTSATWCWPHCVPYLVFDNTRLVGSLELDRVRIEKPSLDLARYFQIAPHIVTRTASLRFEMGEYGWACLHANLGKDLVKICLSDVFPPFGELLAWLKMLDRREVPALFHIDEEGVEKTLAVFGTDDTSRVLFRIVDRYTDEIYIEGIVHLEQLIDAFREGLLKFFKDEFDPEHWRDYGEEGDSSSLKQIILGDPWLIRHIPDRK